MDDTHIGDVLRSLIASRRSVASGAAVALSGLFVTPGADARKKKRNRKRKARCKPNCSDRNCGNDGCGGSCGGCDPEKVCHGGTCCQPESRGATCAGRCGTWTNNCGQAIECATCADGQQCLRNGSCATACTVNDDCGSCGCSNPSVEGEHHCIAGPLQPLLTCTKTDDCPPGSHCQDIGNGGVCIELCD